MKKVQMLSLIHILSLHMFFPYHESAILAHFQIKTSLAVISVKKSAIAEINVDMTEITW